MTLFNFTTLGTAAVDAYAQHQSQNSPNALNNSLKISVIASIIRLFSLAHNLEPFLQKKENPVAPFLLAGGITYAMGSFVVLNKLNHKKPPSQVIGQWAALLSLTSHLAISTISEFRFSSIFQAVFDGYSLYKMANQSWIHIQHEFIQKSYKFKCDYHGPVISNATTEDCVVCYEKTNQSSAKSCLSCAETYYKTKMQEFCLVSLPSDGKPPATVYAQQKSLPNCPITRLFLSHNLFSLCLWDQQKNQLSPIEIQWVK